MFETMPPRLSACFSAVLIVRSAKRRARRDPRLILRLAKFGQLHFDVERCDEPYAAESTFVRPRFFIVHRSHERVPPHNERRCLHQHGCLGNMPQGGHRSVTDVHKVFHT